LPFCSECGAELEVGSEFCGECGHPVSGERVAEQSPGISTPNETIPPSVEQPLTPRARKERKPFLRRAVLAVSGLALVLIILSVLYILRHPIYFCSLQVYSLFKPESKTPDSQEIQQVMPDQPSQPVTPQTPTFQSQSYYEKAALEAFEKSDCLKLRSVVDEGLGLYPNSSKLWKREAGYYLKCGSHIPETVRRGKALSAAKTAYNIDPSAENSVSIGWIYQSMFRDFAIAVKYYERGESHASSNPSLYYFMAVCYEESGYYPKAVSYYERFLNVSPNHKYARDARNRLSVLRPNQDRWR